MESNLLELIGIDPAYLFIFLFVLIVILFILNVSINMKYNRLKRSYTSFMRGKDGKTLERSILDKFDEFDEVSKVVRKNSADIKTLFQEMKGNYQKAGIVKYDAFNEMGGNLSFSLALLDGNNSGWVINSMHTRDGCYTYVKEIVRGESYIELAEEEVQALEQAMFHSINDPEVQALMK